MIYDLSEYSNVDRNILNNILSSIDKLRITNGKFVYQIKQSLYDILLINKPLITRFYNNIGVSFDVSFNVSFDYISFSLPKYNLYINKELSHVISKY